MEDKISLKPKVTLKKKGDSADVASFTKMKVQLAWTLQDMGDGSIGPDFDLMAFYKTKSGEEGGVCSELYNNNRRDMGFLDKFPFIELDGDDRAGNNSKPGDKGEELLKIAQLNHFDELYICVINYDDAVDNKPEVFSKYSGYVTVQSDGGDNFEVPLDSNDPGHVAVICKILNVNDKPVLINVNDTISLSKFATTIPGSSLVVG